MNADQWDELLRRAEQTSIETKRLLALLAEGLSAVGGASHGEDAVHAMRGLLADGVEHAAVPLERPRFDVDQITGLTFCERCGSVVLLPEAHAGWHVGLSCAVAVTQYLARLEGERVELLGAILRAATGPEADADG